MSYGMHGGPPFNGVGTVPGGQLANSLKPGIVISTVSELVRPNSSITVNSNVSTALENIYGAVNLGLGVLLPSRVTVV